MRQASNKSTSAEPMVIITRVFDAPRELVFQAWSGAEHLARWHAPEGCEISIVGLDFRPGGEFRSCIRSPQGHECWCKGVYRDIVEPERIVYSMTNTDAKGNRIDPVSIGMDPDWPSETIVTVTFEDQLGKTKLTLHHTVSEAVAKRTGAHPSWLEMLDRLAETLV